MEKLSKQRVSPAKRAKIQQVLDVHLCKKTSYHFNRQSLINSSHKTSSVANTDFQNLLWPSVHSKILDRDVHDAKLEEGVILPITTNTVLFL